MNATENSDFTERACYVALHCVLRYRERGILEEEVAQVWREAIRLIPTNHPDWIFCNVTFHNALLSRCEQTGDVTDFDETVDLGQRLLAELPRGDSHHAQILSQQAAAVLQRFERGGDENDLSEGLRLAREALDAAPVGHPERPSVLTNLGSGLMARYARFEDLADLDEAIQLGQEALEALPDQDPRRRAKYLSNLGDRLHTRYGNMGYPSDLASAIRNLRQAAKTSWAPEPGYLSNLGSALVNSFRLTGAVADLDEAIQVIQQAVDTAPLNYPPRSKYLSNLGNALDLRYGRTADGEDLNRAVQTIRDAVHTLPTDHPDHPRRTSHLADVLRTRSGVTGSEQDFDEALDLWRQVVAGTPPDHPRWGWDLLNLGGGLIVRHGRTGNPGDYANGAVFLRTAAESELAPPVVRVLAAAMVGRLTEGDDALPPFRLALEMLPRVAPRWMRTAHALSRTQGLTRLGRDAAAAFVQAGDVQGAVVAVEQGRAVVFSRMLQTRTDLSDLADQHPDLGGRLQEALAVLDQPESPVQTMASVDDLRPTQMQDLRAQRVEADRAVEEMVGEVRALGGRWERFFLSPTFEDLTARLPQEGHVVLVNITDRRSDAFLLTREGVTVVPLPGLSEPSAAEQATRFLTATDTLAQSGTTTQDRQEAADTVAQVCVWLWDTVTGPVLDQLGHEPRMDRDYKSWPRLWWIPTGPLAVLPLHAAGHHTPTGINCDRTVIDRVVSSTLPTIGALNHACTRRPPTEHAHRVLAVALHHTPPVGGDPVPDLPGAQDELTSLTDLLDPGLITTLADVAHHAPPTKTGLLQHLPGHAWAHIACHTRTDPTAPTRSALLLVDHTEHPFTVLDLTTTPLPDAHLLYLSACTTARTSPGNLDEPLSFAAAALMAGYRHVIATLWPLTDDAEPADLIYRLLTHAGRPTRWDGADAPLAVHTTTHYLRKLYPHPHRWANHIPLGP